MTSQHPRCVETSDTTLEYIDTEIRPYGTHKVPKHWGPELLQLVHFDIDKITNAPVPNLLLPTNPCRHCLTMPSRKSTTTKSSHGRKGKHTPHESLPTGWHFQAPRWLRALCRYSSLVICSLALSTGLFSLSSQITQGDLAWTSRQYDSWWGIGGLLAWRTAELTVVWLSGYDGQRLTHANNSARSSYNSDANYLTCTQPATLHLSLT